MGDGTGSGFDAAAAGDDLDAAAERVAVLESWDDDAGDGGRGEGEAVVVGG